MMHSARTGRLTLPSSRIELKLTCKNNKQTFRGHYTLVKSQKHEQLLAELTSLADDTLSSWASSNRESITLDFLTWISERERTTTGNEQRRLWELGSKLMTLREGFDLVSMESVSQALDEAAANAAASSSSNSSSSTSLATTTNTSVPEQQQLTTVVEQTAALGLSAEGMALMQQQAVALEASIGIARARSLTELIGRVQLATPSQAQGLMESDAAGRILQVLLSLSTRQERAAALPDAFTPPDSDEDNNQPFFNASTAMPMSFGDDGFGENDDEELFTTPFQLLQAIDLMLKRLREAEDVSARGLLEGDVVGGEVLGGPQLLNALLDLKDDVLTYWEGSSEEC